MGQSLTSSSWESYKRQLDKFRSFSASLGLEHSLPLSIPPVMLYIAQLSQEGLASSTIRTSVSALNYFNLMAGGQDISKDFIISKMLTGVFKSGFSCDSRAPISVDLLQVMTQTLDTICSSQYQALLFRTMFMLAFQGFLRVGEFTVASSKSSNPNLLQLSNVEISTNPRSVIISFQHFKHASSQTPFSLALTPLSTSLDVVSSMSKYLTLRGFAPGPLFMYNAKPVSTNFFNDMLSQVISASNLSSSIKSHSFRIGAATFCLERGYSFDQIQVMGRWKTDAFKKYIRVPSFRI